MEFQFLQICNPIRCCGLPRCPPQHQDCEALLQYVIVKSIVAILVGIGVLVLNNGLYNGNRILSEQYIREMLTEREESYGYLWWIYKKNSTIKIVRKEYSTGKYDSYCMNGVGGSLVTVIPEIDTVICMTCSFVYNPKPRMELINNYLIPYIEKL